MSLLEAIILGIVQGLTEFLPISSTAHLVVIPALLGWQDPGLAFDIALHVGTLAAVLIYFFRDWINILFKEHKLLGLLVAGTIPAGIAGFLFQKQADSTLRTLPVIATTLIGIGIFMWWADKRAAGTKDVAKVSLADSLIIGVAQALSVVPGVSRSGITISTGLLRNLDRPAAARFSFLLSTPIILGAAAKDAWDLFRHEGGVPPEMRTAMAVGIVVSAITGCLTIALFINFLRRRSLAFFVAYRIIFGIIVLALAIFR
jgi:undecaprenyl-diphosphatase